MTRLKRLNIAKKLVFLFVYHLYLLVTCNTWHNSADSQKNRAFNFHDVDLKHQTFDDICQNVDRLSDETLQ